MYILLTNNADCETYWLEFDQNIFNKEEVGINCYNTDMASLFCYSELDMSRRTIIEEKGKSRTESKHPIDSRTNIQ